jgi:hypothetical protein
MRTVALRWIFTLSRVCRTNRWHKANLSGWILNKAEAPA